VRYFESNSDAVLWGQPGPRNPMKIRAKIAVARSGEVENSLEKSKPCRCLIRSVRV
jgi:hypothetical protein